MTKAVCVHFHVSDNRETISDVETSCWPDDDSASC